MTLQQAFGLALQASILMTLFGFGLNATLADVTYLVRRPLLLGRSLLAIVVIMPIVAVTLAKLFEFRVPVEITLVTLSISPIPPLLPGKETKAGGHAPYALGLLVIAGLVSIVTVPLSAWVLSAVATRSFTMAPIVIMKMVLTSVVMPLVAGLVFRELWPAAAARIARPLARVAMVLLIGGLILILIKIAPSLFELLGSGTLVAVLAFTAIGLAVGHVLGGPEPDHSLVLATSTTSRHPAIALAAARANFPNEPYLAAAIILYLLVNVVAGLPYLLWMKRRIATTDTA